MTYDPDRTTILPPVERPYPITEEMPAVGPAGRKPGRPSRFLLGLLAALLVAGIIAIAAILFIDNQRSNRAVGDEDAPPTVAPSDDSDQPPEPTPEELDDDEPGYWQVVNVPDGLNVRSGPGTDNEIVGALRVGDRHIFSTGERARSNGGEWKQIVFGANDATGWVSARFLAPDSAPDASAPTPTVVSSGSQSTVCFGASSTPELVAQITFTNRTDISGVIRTISQGSSVDQQVTGTLVDGRAEVTLNEVDSSQSSTQLWTFSPTSIDLGNGRTLQVVECATIASQLSG